MITNQPNIEVGSEGGHGGRWPWWTSQKSRRRASSRSAFGCHHTSDSFVCRESFSMYSRGMATMLHGHHGHP